MTKRATIVVSVCALIAVSVVVGWWISRDRSHCNDEAYVARSITAETSPAAVANNFMRAINAGRWDVVSASLVPEEHEAATQHMQDICRIDNPTAGDVTPGNPADYEGNYRYAVIVEVYSNVQMKDNQQDFPANGQAIVLVRRSTSARWLVTSFTPNI